MFSQGKAATDFFVGRRGTVISGGCKQIFVCKNWGCVPQRMALTDICFWGMGCFPRERLQTDFFVRRWGSVMYVLPRGCKQAFVCREQEFYFSKGWLQRDNCLWVVGETFFQYF